MAAAVDRAPYFLPEAGPDDKTRVLGSLTAFTCITIEPVGRAYVQYLKSLNTPATEEATTNGIPDDEAETEEDIEILDDIQYLRSLDPRAWKDQDHYRVLGLPKLRRSASADLIKKAYRSKVLRHHPDKRKGRGEAVRDNEDDDYFTCITKAYEILGNPSKRKAYDSVDPEFDDEVPSVSSANKENFYSAFADVFKRNAIWSNNKPVPELGNENSSYQQVDRFYSFWYNFNSWREFSYLDEEEKEKGENRDERKWIEKQNRVVRQKRKKEEMTRIRQLVDNAYACDPRIAKFKEDEKQKKLAQKRAKQEAARLKVEEEEKKRQEEADAAKREKEREEEQARALAEATRKEKEAAKKLIKKERKTLRTICKDYNYFSSREADRVTNMAELDKLCELLPLEQLERLNLSLHESSTQESSTRAAEIFNETVRKLNEQLRREKEEMAAQAMASKQNSASSGSSNHRQWSHDDSQLLIKAVNLFPAGTAQRWEVVANYINQHSQSTNGRKRTAKEVLAKAKELQNKVSDPGVKEEVNKHAFDKFEKTQKSTVSAADESAPTERFETPAEMQGLNPSPWTAEEQRLLEQALKTFPANTPERWERIAECIPNRSKKDCTRRYKDLVEMVKTKKAAKAGIDGKTSAKAS